MKTYKRIGELLAEEGLINEDTAIKIVKEQQVVYRRFGDLLIENKMVSENDIARALSKQHRLKFVDVNTISVMPDAVLSVPEDMAKKHLILPVSITNKILTMVVSDPLNIEGIKEIEFHISMRVQPVIGAKGAILEAIKHHYRFDSSIESITDIPENAVAVPDIDTDEISAPIIRLVNLFLSEASESRASDIHIEPSREYVTVRFRIDGVLIERTRLHTWLHSPIISRIKILARLNIAERRLPQDGGFRIRLGGKDIDVRVSTIPVTSGEKVVIRILDQSNTEVALENLGLSEQDYTHLESLIMRKKGIILVTGPTGSGKTTTLYAIINRIKSPMTNIVTVEDPIEYNITGINQVQVRSGIGLTFARCLRSILRQDPDVILIGEIRDSETAEIAFRAAMTGHLVLSTLHTNDAASTISRLIDIGIPPYIIASTVNGVIAQRLVRRLCPSCRNMKNSECSPAGCNMCKRTGYYGRTGIFEIFTINAGIKELIVSGKSEEAIKSAAKAGGAHSLADDAFSKVKEGITTKEEVYRVVETEIF
ncbi:MAG: ATPase, T2SS/T4P/T4SS family [Nitrospira sp.]|nr:ATPase, T2SS/T4P/T4SS family [Nitrospira sp.]